MPDILAEVARLRAKHRRSKYAIPFPDLSIKQVSPTSDRFDRVVRFSQGRSVPGLTISHFHKQGYQVVSKNDVQFAGRKV